MSPKQWHEMMFRISIGLGSGLSRFRRKTTALDGNAVVTNGPVNAVGAPHA